MQMHIWLQFSWRYTSLDYIKVHKKNCLQLCTEDWGVFNNYFIGLHRIVLQNIMIDIAYDDIRYKFIIASWTCVTLMKRDNSLRCDFMQKIET